MVTRKMSHDKFSTVEQDHSDDGVYKALYKFVLQVCWDKGDPNNIMMDGDELFGELLEEIAKGLKHYKDLPFNQKLAVIRMMLDNRVAELRYKYYVTHRKQHVSDLSLEFELTSPSGIINYHSDELSPEGWLVSMERVAETRDLLTTDSARAVFDCIIGNKNQRLTEIMLVHAIRATTVGTNPGLKIKPWMVADALMLSEKEVNAAFKDIKEAYSKVSNDN